MLSMRSVVFAEKDRLEDVDYFFFVKVYLLVQSWCVESKWICELYIVFCPSIKMCLQCMEDWIIKICLRLCWNGKPFGFGVCAFITTVIYWDCRKWIGLYGGYSRVSDLKKCMSECGFDDVFDISAYCASKCWLAFNGVTCFWGICLIRQVAKCLLVCFWKCVLAGP